MVEYEIVRDFSFISSGSKKRKNWDKILKYLHVVLLYFLKEKWINFIEV